MKIVAQLVVGPHEADRYLPLVLENLKVRRLCDTFAICLNNADPKTKSLVNRYTSNIVEDNREWGKYQPYIKENLVSTLVKSLQPDWVLSLDADEVLEERLNRAKLEELVSKKNDVAYFFHCVELWNDEKSYRPDYTFEDVRLYRFFPGLSSYRKLPVHCGMVPEVLHQWATYSNFFFYHYGLMKKEDRIKKVERYKKYDTKNIYQTKTWYEGLLQENVERVFEKDRFIEKLPSTLFRKKLPMPFSDQVKQQQREDALFQGRRIYKFINPHGQSICFSELEEGAKAEKHYLQRLKQPGWEYLGVEVIDTGDLGYVSQASVANNESIPVAEDPKVVPAYFECDICGYLGASEKAMKMHKTKKHS